MPLQFFRNKTKYHTIRFDQQLGPGAGTPWLCGEDSDYLLYHKKNGAQIIRWHQIQVYHPPVQLSSAQDSAKAIGYGRGSMRLMIKHGYGRICQLILIGLAFKEHC